MRKLRADELKNVVQSSVQGNRHTMFVPVAHAALYFSEPELEPDEDFEIER